MSGLRERLDELVEDTPVYGDLDRAVQRADRTRRRNAGLGLGAVAASVVLGLVVGTQVVSRDRAEGPPPAAPPTGTKGLVLGALRDGDVTPGRYRYVVQDTCEPTMGCPLTTTPSLPDVAVTVPAGWRARNYFHLIEPTGTQGTAAPRGAGLVLGWTNAWVGLHSQPCLRRDVPPDVPVGPTVDDFVDAVAKHPLLDASEPRDVRLGAYRGRFFTLTAPSDLSGCPEWRPWDPSPYAQGPGNRWDLWVMDVEGTRMVIMAGSYAATPAHIKAELRDMAESVRFVTRTPRG